jgi:glycosyltransferase involved in cell wall biosynthesis
VALNWLFGFRLIYHEHDSPLEGTGHRQPASTFMRLVLAARRACAQRAELAILPNETRAAALKSVAAGATVLTVWNCPARAEVVPEPRRIQSNGLTVLFHGSVTPDRGLEPVLHALVLLPTSVTLVVVGYETVGQPGYLAQLAELAQRLGVADRAYFKGAMSRDDLMRHCATCDIGLALMKWRPDDINEVGMVGASNKPFDYLACGLPVLVSDLPDWTTTFVDAGYGRSCDPASPPSIAAALQWFLDHPDERLAMGERGRQKILMEWHYEKAFEPVAVRMQANRADWPSSVPSVDPIG